MTVRGRTLGGGPPGRAVPPLTLALSALVCACASFALIDDPEGPNLLVVAGLGFVLFLLALVPMRSRIWPALHGWRRLIAGMSVQLLAAMAIGVLMR